MPLRPRKNIESLCDGIHGGIDFSEFEQSGIDPDSVIDFSVSTNPLGPPEDIPVSVMRDEIWQYPDSVSTRLVRAIAEKTGIRESCVLAGNGSTELIRLAATAYLDPGDAAVILGPTYGEYRTACEIAGARITTVEAEERTGFSPDIDRIISVIGEQKPALFFLCNPNNPTGSCLAADELKRILEAAPDTLVLLDEAYAAFTDLYYDMVKLIKHGNLLIVRSMTKDYAIAGLRLGYALGDPAVIGILKRIAPPWNINVLAQKTGIMVLHQETYLAESRNAVQSGKRYLTRELAALGFECIPSSANFFLVKTGNAAGMRKRLLGKGILVRDCTSFGLPEHIRIAVQSADKNIQLITAFKELNND